MKVAFLAFILWLLYFASEASACDRNEECNRCIASAFGHCIQHGNDPICEARKAACPVIPGPLNPFDWTDAAQNCLQNVSRCSQDVLSAAQECVRNPASCPQQMIGQLLQPIVQSYISYMERQVHTWYSLRPGRINVLQRFYPEIDLRKIRMAFGIDTIHGQNVTIGNEIFFVSQLNLDDENDGALLFHELEHSVQYARRGSVGAFMAEYLPKAAEKVIEKRSFKIHDFIDLENAANAKADLVTPQVFGQFFAEWSQSTASPIPAPPGPPNPPPNTLFSFVCMTPVGGCYMNNGSWPVGSMCYCGGVMGQVVPYP